jgi:multicomponent Na+:H+ antiporter subunit F
MTPAAILEWSIDAGFVMVMVSVALGFFRLIKGPSLADRVVALDLMTVLIVAFCGLYALRSGERAFLDVAIVLALIGFLATVAFARFIERKVIRAKDTRLAETLQAEEDTK